MSIDVKQCPACKKYNVRYSIVGPRVKPEKTEIVLLTSCPDCGHRWAIVYLPDEIRNR